MWDEGVTSKTIDSLSSSWETLTQDKIDTYYNIYAQVLQEFGMPDVSLRLQYISPEEEISFLSIEDGEILYDYFEDAAA